MKSHKLYRFGGVCAGVALALCGCTVQFRVGRHAGSGPEASPQTDRSFFKRFGTKTAPVGAIAWNWTPVDELKPVRSGPGILICEPAAMNASPELAALGSGCSRWLHLFVGGDGKLGATPLWTSADRARQELGRKDLRLALADAGKLYPILGITHVALGTVTGSPQQVTLTYRLYALPGLQPVGPPVALTGSEEQVAAGLPSAAQKLAAALGVGTINVPARTGLSARDLEFLGRFPWLPNIGLTPAQRRPLEMLAPRSPLAAFILLCSGDRNDVHGVAPAIRTLIRQAPENALVMGEIGYKIGFPAALPEVRKQLDLDRRKFPASSMLAHCEVWRQRSTDGKPDLEHRAAEKTVQLSPNDPETWLALGGTINSEAERVRESRFISDLGPDELDYINRVYPQWLTAVNRATTLDPLYGHAWFRLAQAASFASEDRLADRAFWKAVRLERQDRYAMWYWGMQMYQPKWQDDPEKLEKVARMALAEYRYDSRSFPILNVLKQVENDRVLNERLFVELSDKMIYSLRESVRLHPKSVSAHEELAQGYVYRGRDDDAIREFQAEIRLDPNNAYAHFRLAPLMKWAGNYASAIQEYQTALRLKPDDPRFASAKDQIYQLQMQIGGGDKTARGSGPADDTLPDPHL